MFAGRALGGNKVVGPISEPPVALTLILTILDRVFFVHDGGRSPLTQCTQAYPHVIFTMYTACNYLVRE